MIRFEVPLAPAAKGRPRFANGHAFTPARTREFEYRVALYAGQAAQAANDALAGPLSFRVWFYLPNRRNDPDIDNLIKAVLDGTFGHLVANDRQVVHIEAWKLYDKDNPRTVVEVSSLAATLRVVGAE